MIDGDGVIPTLGAIDQRQGEIGTHLDVIRRPCPQASPYPISLVQLPGGGQRLHVDEVGNKA